MSKTQVPMTLIIKDGIDPEMILKSLSTMVGVEEMKLHRKGARWKNGYLVKDKEINAREV